MHYKNGREAKPGDKVVNLATGESGVLYDCNAQSNTCNGRLAAHRSNDPYITIGESLHLDDFRKLAEAVPFKAE